MKVLIAISWVLMLFVSGCASTPENTEQSVIPERTVTTFPATDKDFVILRQPGSTTGQTNHEPGDGGVDQSSNPQSSTAACPSGQLMATRIVSGETGTRISQECVTPFASKGRRNDRQRPVAIKVRNVVSGPVTRK